MIVLSLSSTIFIYLIVAEARGNQSTIPRNTTETQTRLDLGVYRQVIGLGLTREKFKDNVTPSRALWSEMTSTEVTPKVIVVANGKITDGFFGRSYRGTVREVRSVVNKGSDHDEMLS